MSDIDVAVITALIGVRVGQPTEDAQPRRPTTIAGLVQQCRELPASEVTACRRRICNGYWGKAQACPVESKGSGR